MRISKCSRLSLSTCGERTTVYLRIFVGSGTGPRTLACVRTTVSTIFFVDWSMTSWSYAFSRMRIFCPDACGMFIRSLSGAQGTCAAVVRSLASGLRLRLAHHRPSFEDLDDAAGPDGAAAFTDREP